MKRSALKRKTQMPKRKKSWRVKPKQSYREPGRLAFRVAVLNRPCVLTGRDHICSGPLDPHHVIEKRALKRYGFLSELWNPDNGIPVCRKAHEDHTTGYRRLPRAVLPAESLAFAERLGLSHLIDRLYGEDPSPEKEKEQSRC